MKRSELRRAKALLGALYALSPAVIAAAAAEAKWRLSRGASTRSDYDQIMSHLIRLGWDPKLSPPIDDEPTPERPVTWVAPDYSVHFRCRLCQETGDLAQAGELGACSELSRYRARTVLLHHELTPETPCRGLVEFLGLRPRHG